MRGEVERGLATEQGGECRGDPLGEDAEGAGGDAQYPQVGDAAQPFEELPQGIVREQQRVAAGIPLANQTVLLRGVNDVIDTLTALCTALLRLRVRPYYLHQLDPVRGTGHFRVPIERGLQLVAALRQQVSGLAVPHFIIDLPGGRGKVALTPESLVRLGATALIRLADGGVVELPNAEGGN